MNKTVVSNRKPVTSTQLKSAEARLIEYLRDIKWGSLEITVQDGTPVLIKAAVKTIKLT